MRRKLLMKIGKCPKCKYFKQKEWSWGDWEQKLFGVLGHCTDGENPDFNEWALTFGRGIPQMQSIFSPKWCKLRKDFKGVDRCR